MLFMYAREFEEDNHYAHPLDFLTGKWPNMYLLCVLKVEHVIKL